MSKIFTPFHTCLLGIALLMGFSFTSHADKSFSIGLVAGSAFIVLFIHELGHVIGGKLAGYRFLFLTVGPVTIEKNPALKIVPNQSWIAFGGLASCLPSEIDLTKMVKKHKWFVAGGPLFTLLAFIISLFYWSVTKAEMAMMLTALNLAIFFTTAIPFKGTFNSDGSVFLLLHKGGKKAETYLAGLILLKEMMSPRSPSDWDEQLIQEAYKTEASPEAMTTAFLLFYYHLMNGHYEQASESIAAFKELPINRKTKFRLQFASHIRQIDSFLSPEPDLTLIKNLHKQMSAIDKVSYKRSEAILAYLIGNTEKAYSLLDDVMRTCRQGSTQYGYFHAELMLTGIVRKRMDSPTAKECRII
ncbi:hypothetical protein [Bacillus sp. 7894-2]|uniref:hypothetical protein n=1 Tax=Bacillus sp. 7894-2 TaxID=2021695 RepID=UPI000BA74037|nr:hypothetical protein [Bacillus sp. 7894-2]PAE23285.1 hypothetical protein CHI10_19000 [Bacillus sp. 7894-2]